MELAKSLIIEFAFAQNYFDISEFEESPLKRVLNYEFRAANSLFKSGFLYALKRNKAIVNNSPLGFGGTKTYEYETIARKD